MEKRKGRRRFSKRIREVLLGENIVRERKKEVQKVQQDPVGSKCSSYNSEERDRDLRLKRLVSVIRRNNPDLTQSLCPKAPGKGTSLTCSLCLKTVKTGSSTLPQE